MILDLNDRRKEYAVRTYLLDSGAAYDVIGKSQLTNSEYKKIKKLAYPISVNTANGEAINNQCSLPTTNNQQDMQLQCLQPPI